MSVRKDKRRAQRRACEEKQEKRTMSSLLWALAVLVILGIIAFSIMGNEF